MELSIFNWYFRLDIGTVPSVECFVFVLVLFCCCLFVCFCFCCLFLSIFVSYFLFLSFFLFFFALYFPPNSSQIPNHLGIFCCPDRCLPRTIIFILKDIYNRGKGGGIDWSWDIIGHAEDKIFVNRHNTPSIHQPNNTPSIHQP